ncbi:hypothetical protein OHV05_26895 [Kitasatospora sp. NBC_00070]
MQLQRIALPVGDKHGQERLAGLRRLVRSGHTVVLSEPVLP